MTVASPRRLICWVCAPTSAVEIAYAKASRLLASLAGSSVSARSIRRDVIAMAPERIGPEIDAMPVLLLDGTGERAGKKNGGVALHLAIGLVARRREGGRVSVQARLLGPTVAEGWSVMGDLLGELRPGLILVDGEEELSALAAERFPGVPVQRCLWHLARGVYRAARYGDRASENLADDFRRQLEALLTAAYRDGDLDAARPAYAELIDDTEGCGAMAAAAHLRATEGEVFTFLTHPGAGRLLFGDKGRPELGTGVLERVMREMNRRTDVGVRWSIAGGAGHPRGEALAEVRSRSVVASEGHRRTTKSAVQSRGLRSVSTLCLATQSTGRRSSWTTYQPSLNAAPPRAHALASLLMGMEPLQMEDKLRDEIGSAAKRGESEFFTWFAGGEDARSAETRGAWDMAYHILRPPVARYLKDTDQKSALEIGYGGGRLLAAASCYFSKVYGLDIHDNADIVADRLKSIGVNNFELLNTTTASVPLPDASVDFVYSLAVFAHVSSFSVFEQYVAETARVLRSGGVASLYVARSYSGHIKAIPLVAQRVHYGLENIAELAQSTFGRGYRERQPTGGKWGLTLAMSRAAAIRVCRRYGLRTLKTGASYYSIPASYPRLGVQRWLCLVKT